MKSIKNEMLKSLFLSAIALLVILFGLYEAITNFVIHQEVSKARLLAHSLVYTREYLSKFAPYIEFKETPDGKKFHPFSLTPAYAVNQIALMISKRDGIEVRQLSDNYRDPANKATGDALKAIEFFKKNKDAKDFFVAHKEGSDSHIFYAYPLRVEQSCLKCHGVVGKDVPQDLYEKIKSMYGDRAFGYKLGEIRGVIAVKIPFSTVKHTINVLFFELFVVILLVYSIGFYLFLRINSKIIKDINKFNNYFNNTFLKNQYRPFKDEVYFKESNFIKSRLNEVVRAIKNYRRDLFEVMYYNQLTGLPNRARLMDVLKRSKAPMILLDIDSFKEINYFYGEKIANEVILQVAERLKKYKVFHIKVDEFVILRSEATSKEDLYNFTKELIEQLEKPYEVDDFVIYLKFRAGLAWNKRDLVSLFSALDATKILKKDIVFCEEAKHIRESYKEHLEWIKKLKSAINDGRIVTYYQPIVDKNQQVCKYEALVRLIDERGKVITPYFFLDIAKKSRLYEDISKIVISNVIEKINKTGKPISVNITTYDMESDSLREFFISKIDTLSDPSKLSIEIVESEDIKKSKKSAEFIKTLKEKGVKIVIDDFGSGFANFDYLFSLCADGIKIDGSLVKRVLDDKKSVVIIKTIVEFAKEFNMQVVAEYVENKEIFDKLKELGVECYQGYFYSKPREDIIT